MTRILSIFALFSILSSCAVGVAGNGNVTEKNREVESFNGISASGMFQIHFIQSDNISLKVVADDNLHELIETYVNDRVLSVRTTESIRNAKKLELYISAPSLSFLDLSGAVSVDNKGEISGERLMIQTSGAAEINLNVRVEEIEIGCSGATEVDLRGRADKVEINASGATEIKMFELEALRMSLDLSGASEVKVNVTKELRVSASGASEIVYRGNPKLSRSDLSGASSIKQD
jgi:hypothetical protein